MTWLATGVVWFACWVCVIGDPKAIVRLQKSNEIFLGLVGNFNRRLDPKKAISHSIVMPSNSNGCKPWQDQISKKNFIGLVDRGNCTFAQKTLMAQEAGAHALIVVSHDDSIVPMSASEEEIARAGGKDSMIPCVMVGQSLKKALETMDMYSNVSIEHYEGKFYDSMMFVVIIIATCIVGLGAYYASDKERSRLYGGSTASFRQRQEVQELDASMAWSFVIVASLGLLLMFYFVQYLFKLVLFIFVCGGINGLSLIGSHCIEYFHPALAHSVVRLRFIDTQLRSSDILSFVPATLLSVSWYWFRFTDWAWLLQDFICLGLLLVVQRSVRLPNLRVGAILLGTAFIYDIFWVFLSPIFFTRSVMVEVATYTHENARDSLPVALKFPKLDDPFHGPMILGLGDIALPGLLISYLLRYDYMSRIKNLKEGYFLPCLIGYGVGLLLTDINLIYMQHGQPALLFLVPCTLGVALLLGYQKGDLKFLWNGMGNPMNTALYEPVKTEDTEN